MDNQEIRTKLDQLFNEQANQKHEIGSLRGKHDLLAQRLKAIEDVHPRLIELEKLGVRNDSELKAIRSDIDELKESGEQHSQMLLHLTTELNLGLSDLKGRLSAAAGIIGLLVATAEIYSALK